MGNARSPLQRRCLALRRGRLAPLPAPDHRLPKTTTVTQFSRSKTLINKFSAQPQKIAHSVDEIGKEDSGFYADCGVYLIGELTINLVHLKNASLTSISKYDHLTLDAHERNHAKISKKHWDILVAEVNGFWEGRYREWGGKKKATAIRRYLNSASNFHSLTSQVENFKSDEGTLGYLHRDTPYGIYVQKSLTKSEQELKAATVEYIEAMAAMKVIMSR